MTRLHSVTLLLVVLLTACSTSVVSGRASHDPGPPVLPARPRELNIAELDPCSSLTDDQVRSLGVSFDRRETPVDTLGPGCSWSHSSTTFQIYSVFINTHGGVERAFGQPDLHVITVAGFGAVDTPGAFSLGEHECIVNVDVATGQAVQVSYLYNGNPPITHPLACERAHHAAELAMQTILSKLG